MDSTGYFIPRSIKIGSRPGSNILSTAYKLLDKISILIRREKTHVSTLPPFRSITVSDMPKIWKYLEREKGRTTDFSYGGVLMWVDYYNYEFCIYKDTLFIKGVLEDHRDIPAFSLPVGKLPLAESIWLLRKQCQKEGIPLYMSAVPEHALEELEKLHPCHIKEIPDISDYIYEAESLAYLQGKKNGKKRNHVNKFISTYPNWELEELTDENANEALGFMDKYDREGDDNESATSERRLTRRVIEMIASGEKGFSGGILKANGQTCAITIGDIKGDTLFIHIEKALREYHGAYEMINKEFASKMIELHPGIRYINREDDAGDEGLRKAKLSYHPCAMLRKYNVQF
ncbi:MAG: phosphatidylglycerol lysyltransferase domain-containing protein [Muribaculaceae bacterium]|nr:phosphatidylglycerol lysyltransferase domain-containing protein [Muribaculaceae bacterium]